jgi:excisionase family DNA binding protein
VSTLAPFQETPAVLDPLPEQWITAKAACALLSIGMRTLYRLLDRGQIPQPVRFSRKLMRFDRAALIDWLRQGGFPCNDRPAKARPAKPEGRKRKPAVPPAVVPAAVPAVAPGPMEPPTPCEDCGRPLWSMTLRGGKLDVYCPHCIRVSLGEAS